jgi:N-acyl-D-aspartate/D-glutamate deacylase
MVSMGHDVVLANGLFFDGTGAAPLVRHIGISGGKVAAISDAPLEGAQVLDATGKWVTPGFLDLHTHYDAELLAAPALGESVRHGVTTVTVGSCSISTILADPLDCSDMFTRVESVPRTQVLPLLEAKKTWDSPRGYVDFLRAQPLGPNVTAFLGHSDLRTRVLGLGRAVDGKTKPTEPELAEMERWLEEALDVGLLGLSTMTNPWDKLDGDRHRSAALPSTYASMKETRRLNGVLRRRGRILQSAPNIVTKVNALAFLAASCSLGLRKKLKTTLITMADAKTSPGLHVLLGGLTRFVNRIFGGDLRWQTLPVPFEVYADGIDLVVFEEFGAGRAALHLADEVERNELMSQEAYRRSFRKDYEKRFSPRVWQRDFHDAFIVDCPEQDLVGRSFGEVAEMRGLHPVDLYLDLVVAHGKKLRWRTTIANHRPKEVARMMKEPAALIGFADSGAHIRNMAFYSFPLRMLKVVRDAERAGAPVMPLGQAVWRLTGEIGDWLGVDAGKLRLGDRADAVVIDPAALDDRLAAYHEAPMDGLDGLVRMVNRSDGAVRAVLVNGRVAFQPSGFATGLGRERGFGQFLPARA